MEKQELTTEQLTMMWTALKTIGNIHFHLELFPGEFTYKCVVSHYCEIHGNPNERYRIIRGIGDSDTEAAIDLARQLRII